MQLLVFHFRLRGVCVSSHRLLVTLFEKTIKSRWIKCPNESGDQLMYLHHKIVRMFFPCRASNGENERLSVYQANILSGG